MARRRSRLLDEDRGFERVERENQPVEFQVEGPDRGGGLEIRSGGNRGADHGKLKRQACIDQRDGQLADADVKLLDILTDDPGKGLQLAMVDDRARGPC